MSSFDKSKPMPKWLLRKHANKNTQRGQRYYIHRWYAQPAWANRKLINNIYRQARAMRKQGKKVEVDHIYPLQHPNFCGLHVHNNLRIIPAKENAQKSNCSWPGYGQVDMFLPDDFELTFQV